MTLLLGLLAIAYIGNMLMHGRGLRGYGLPSGTEWVLLGCGIGPHGLCLIDDSVLHAFDPVTAMAVGWLAMTIGVSVAGRPESKASLVAGATGMLLALLSAGLVAALAFVTARGLGGLHGRELWIAASGVGLVSCETTRHAIDWVVERHAARGPLSAFVGRMAARDDVVPLVLTALPFAFAMPEAPAPIGFVAWYVAPIVLGLLLGGTCAALLSFEKRASGGFGVLLGAALLTSGLAWRTGISPLAAMLALGIAVAFLSRHRRELQEALARTEHSVLLPTLLLAGARAPLDLDSKLWLVVLAACGGRALLRLLAAPWIARAAQTRARPGLALGLGLLPTGALTMTVGLAFALRFPDRAGSVVLCAAAAQTVLGEIFGPAALRSALERAGELAQPAPPEAAAPVEHPA